MRKYILFVSLFIVLMVTCVFSLEEKSAVLINKKFTDGQEVLTSTEGIKIINKFSSMEIGDSRKIEVEYASETEEKVVFSSSDSNVLSVDEYGDVTAVSAGQATLTASIYGKSDSFCVLVDAKEQANVDQVQTDQLNLQQAQESSLSFTQVPSVKYRTHIQDIGWQDYKFDGEISGTYGLSKRLEAIQISLDNSAYSGSIQYRTHIQDIGWQDYRADGTLSGTSGQSKRLEAIQIKLIGQIAEYYDIYYRVHAQNLGWLGWTKNDQMAGTSGYGYRLEAIEIKLVIKGENVTSSAPSYYFNEVEYRSHVQDIGWQEYKSDGSTSGTTGSGKRLEAIQIKLNEQKYSGSIEYRTHVENIGWQDYKKDGEISGTLGQSKRIEAMQVRLTGEMANYYDVYYRVHAQNYGWLGWAKNDELSGTVGYGYRLEALEIKLVNKGDVISSDVPAYYQDYVRYSSHVSGIGWQDNKADGNISGTIGQSRAIESFRVSLVNKQHDGNVEYKSYIGGFGWETEFRKNNSISGTTGQSKNIEAIQIKLTGEMDEYYDIYYRVHSQNIGWLGWAKNGEIAGTIGYGYRLEAIEIKLVEKGLQVTNGDGDSYLFTAEGYYIISSKLDDNKVIDVTYASLKDCSNVALYDRNDSIAQIWKIKNLNNGFYSITSSMNPNVYLTSNGINAEVNRYNGSDSQLWELVDDGDGFIYIISKLNDLYLDVVGGSTVNLTNIGVHEFNSGDNQRFKLIPYSGRLLYNGVDVASHQGTIDWATTESNINFAIIRLGYGSDYSDQDDAEFIKNIRGCEENNIPYGVYIYSYALNSADAQSEAYHTLRLLKEAGSNFLLGVWFDMEDADGYKARHGFPSSSTLVDICDTFGNIVQSSGYKVGIYASVSWFNGILNSPRLDKYDKWIAQWPGPNTYDWARNSSTTYGGSYSYWQFCSDGRINGIYGRNELVDLDLGYNIFD